MQAGKLTLAVRKSCAAVILLMCAAACTQEGSADREFTVAVATNFLSTLQRLTDEFTASTGHAASIVSGSTGLLYAQIRSGAPYDVLLAADQARPRELAASGIGSAESVFTYALGRLALWSADPQRVDAAMLENPDAGEYRWFAIADPEVAPYGVAAQQALTRLGAWASMQPRIVRAQNVAQAFAMTETGNAEVGMVALAQVLAYPGDSSYVEVPMQLHEPVRQDAVLLAAGADNAAAREFMAFMQSPQARAIIAASGYALPDQD